MPVAVYLCLRRRTMEEFQQRLHIFIVVPARGLNGLRHYMGVMLPVVKKYRYGQTEMVRNVKKVFH